MGGSAAETNRLFRTAFDIVRGAPPTPPWIVEPWVASGALTELDGKAKSAGKTTFVTHLVQAVLEGSLFLGSATRRTPVVFLTEQAEVTFVEALKRAGIAGRDDLYVLFRHEVRGRAWPAVAAMAQEACRRREAGLLVVDTLAPYAGFKGDSENDAGAALEAVAPLQEAAASGLGVLMVRHEGKGEERGVGESGRGSSAFAGAVDIVMSLRRPPGGAPATQRSVHALSRFGPSVSWTIDLTDDGYVLLGDGDGAARASARQVLLDSLPECESGALPMDALLKATKGRVRRSMCQGVLADLEMEGVVHRVGRGAKGSPVRFWRSGFDSAALPPIGGQNQMACNGAREDAP